MPLSINAVFTSLKEREPSLVAGTNHSQLSLYCATQRLHKYWAEKGRRGLSKSRKYGINSWVLQAAVYYITYSHFSQNKASEHTRGWTVHCLQATEDQHANCALGSSHYKELISQGTHRCILANDSHLMSLWGRERGVRIMTRWSSGKFLPQQNLVHLMASQVNKTRHPSVQGNGFLWLPQSTELRQTLSDPFLMLQKAGRKQPLWLFSPLQSTKGKHLGIYYLLTYLSWCLMYSVQQRLPVGQLLLKVSTLTKELTTSSNYSGKEQDKNIFCNFRQIMPDP